MWEPIFPCLIDTPNGETPRCPFFYSPVLGLGFGGEFQHLMLNNGFTRHQPSYTIAICGYSLRQASSGDFLYFTAFGLFTIKGFQLARSQELNWFHRSLARAGFISSCSYSFGFNYRPVSWSIGPPSYGLVSFGDIFLPLSKSFEKIRTLCC